MKKKHSILLLPVILLSYFIVGFPDGAFTISWDAMQHGLGLVTFHSGIILVGYSITYTLAGVLLDRFNRFMKLQSVYLLGLVIMGIGFIGLGLSQNFIMVLIMVTVYGYGTGAMASSMNAYMAKHFTAMHNNWMHFFWGAGAAVSPLIMGRLLVLDLDANGVAYNYSWFAGYATIAAIVAVVGVIVLLSMYRKVWTNDDTAATAQQAGPQERTPKRYLTKKWHQVVEIMIFFFLGGTDYTVVFFTSTVFMMEHDLSLAHVAIFSTMYYVGMTVGRLFFGRMARTVRELSIIRMGIGIAVVGIVLLWFAGSIARGENISLRTIGIVGMTITGFGLGPLLPTLVSDTSNRFSPRILSKLVGYELAAFGAGIAVLFFITSLVLTFTTYMALFPIVLAFVVLVCVCNEVLAN